jgi:hypothetical protein
MKVLMLVEHDVDPEDVTDRVTGDVIATALKDYLEEAEQEGVVVMFVRFFEDWKGGDNMETETESAPTPEEGEPTQSEESEGTEESGEETGGEG